MKMCLAPCFAGCTDEDYAAEVQRVADFLKSRGASYMRTLEGQREAASASMDFERAAMLHRNFEKAEGVRRSLPEIARQLDALNAVILQRGAVENSVAAFVVKSGRIADPFIVRFDELASQPRSVEEIFRGTLASAATTDAARLRTDPIEDHLVLLARWYYAHPREGEIFFAGAHADDWPYRRILRACGRLLAPASTASGSN
jgi:excinuclease UvrABC nuclease subunit